MGNRKTIAVVGGGSAGFTAARCAADLGARVVFFMGENADRASLCVNRGCMPSKALFVPIDTMHHAREQGWLSVGPRRPDAYLGQIVAWKDREIARFRAYRQRAIRKRAGEDFLVVRSNARFVDAHTLEADGERYPADAVIVATGSVVVSPPIEGLEEVGEAVWTNDEILDNSVLPESLAVIGAGAIGLEFSLRYARLGSAVTVVSHSRILPRFPARFGERLKAIYEREGVRMLPGHEVVGIRRDMDGGFVVETEGPDGFESVVSQRVLLATGRRPALDTLELEAAGIECDGRGRVEVGEDMRVAGHAHIFLVGDAGGQRMVVHHAHIEAGIAAENAVTDGERRWGKRANLQVIFTDPEFAFAGLSAEEAQVAGRRVVTASKESRLVGKLHLAGDDLGVGEFIADADDARLLGAGLLCQEASDLIHVPAYVIEHGQTVHQAATVEYYHPTKVEIVSGIIDHLCQELGGTPFCRADE